MNAGKRLIGKVRQALYDVWARTEPRQHDVLRERMLWSFRGQESVRNWACISDRDVRGASECKLETTSSGRALFHGNLSSALPADGQVKYSGYCAIRSPPYKNALGQLELFDLSEYDGLEFRVRGDGRKFTANIQTEDYIQEDLYQAFLITRGGPFWEEIQLSFDSFILTNRGYVQDFHIKFAPQKVRTIGVLLADRTNGPFRLEIDYIKAVEMPSLRVKSEPGQWSRMDVPHS